MVNNGTFRYKWFSAGDFPAAVTIIFDNLTVLTFISLILKFGFNFPEEIIIQKIIPGTVIGVLVGNIGCIILGFRLAYKTKMQVITLPFGLDAPSGIGFTLCIIGPAFVMFKEKGLDINSAANMAWQIGVGLLFLVGLIKIFFIPFISKLKKMLLQVALLGAIGGVALALIGFIPLMSIFRSPIVGIVSLGIILCSMFANMRLPFNLSGVVASILVGFILYYVLQFFGINKEVVNTSLHVSLLLPYPSFAFLNNFKMILEFLPLGIPFALLVVFGNMSVVASAECSGECYNIKELIMVDGIATIMSALFGGIAQTTSYAGFPAYKKMNARSLFMMMNIIVIGIGGIFGIVGFLVHIIPESAIAPLLIFVAFEITAQGFLHSDNKYYIPILLAFLPSLARIIEIKLTDGVLITGEKLQQYIFTNTTPAFSDHLMIVILGNGFIITGVLWATLLGYLIDKRYFQAFISAIILSLCSFFGIIHSVYVSGQSYLPWNLPSTVMSLPYQISCGYFILGFAILLLSKVQHK